jgi:AAA15 family ATPase/GTPase
VKHHFDLDLSREQGELSGGTQKIVALTGPLLQVLNQGGVLVVDELDVRLHPLITYRIVKLFASEVTNPQNAQLIFTTHEAHLLSERLFRRDQVWFTEKDKDGATCLYSLVEFKMEKDRSFKHDYLSGRYGAIPIIWEIRSLGQVLDI